MTRDVAVGRRYGCTVPLAPGFSEKLATVSGFTGSDRSLGAAIQLFSAAFDQLLADPAMGLELAGLIHSFQEFQFAPDTDWAAVGELEVAAEITSVSLRRGMRLIEVALTASAGGGPLLSGETRIMARAHKAGEEDHGFGA